MWIESVKLKNIKCFEDIELLFTRNQRKGSTAKPYRWITFLGENGVGKSAVLQAIGLLLAGPEAAKELLPRPTGWVRKTSEEYGKLTATIHQEKGDAGKYGDKRRRKTFSYAYFVTGDKPIRVQNETYTEPALIEENSKVLSWLRANAFASGTQGWFAAGYGPFRRLPKLLTITLAPRTRTFNFITQFSEKYELATFDRWMFLVDGMLSRDPNDLVFQHMRFVGEKAITRLLPGNVKLAGVTKEHQIQFEINGQIVSTIGLPDGFRSIIALAGDLIWYLLQAFPGLIDPTQDASGVVLIDELDIHLSNPHVNCCWGMGPARRCSLA